MLDLCRLRQFIAVGLDEILRSNDIQLFKILIVSVEDGSGLLFRHSIIVLKKMGYIGCRVGMKVFTV